MDDTVFHPARSARMDAPATPYVSEADMATTAPSRTGRSESAAAQRRTLRVLVVTQVLGGVGAAVGLSVGALLVAGIAGGPGLSGLAPSAVAVGAALLVIPVTRLMQSRGRRPGLALALGVGALGGGLVVTAAALESVALAIGGMFLFGGGTAANLQARYTAVDLAEPAHRGRQMSLVVWATTVGAVAGPNLAAPSDALLRGYGVPPMTGPFVFSVVAFAVAGVLLVVFLRPDPLLLARRLQVTASGVSGGSRTMRGALAEVRRNRTALLGVSAV
ncbi:MAG: MFS transporter, partial [Micromonosporaceae bacterium]